jgi:hypothetical protein
MSFSSVNRRGKRLADSYAKNLFSITCKAQRRNMKG